MSSSLVTVVWCSTTGAAQQLAEAAGAGLGASSSRGQVIHALDVRPEDLLSGSGYMWVCPEHLGSMAGPMKTFFDLCYYPVLGKIEGRPYCSIVSAGTDGQATARQLQRISTGWRLREVAEPWIVLNGAQTPEAVLAPKLVDQSDLERAYQAGLAMGEALALGIY